VPVPFFFCAFPFLLPFKVRSRAGLFPPYIFYDPPESRGRPFSFFFWLFFLEELNGKGRFLALSLPHLQKVDKTPRALLFFFFFPFFFLFFSSPPFLLAFVGERKVTSLPPSPFSPFPRYKVVRDRKHLFFLAFFLFFVLAGSRRSDRGSPTSFFFFFFRDFFFSPGEKEKWAFFPSSSPGSSPERTSFFFLPFPFSFF